MSQRGPAAVCVIAVALGLAACGDPCGNPHWLISASSGKTLAVGDTLTLTLSAFGEDASFFANSAPASCEDNATSVTWTSTNPAVARVVPRGEFQADVLGVGPGTDTAFDPRPRRRGGGGFSASGLLSHILSAGG